MSTAIHADHRTSTTARNRAISIVFNDEGLHEVDPREYVGRPILPVGEYVRSDFDAACAMDPTRSRRLGRRLDVLSQAGFLALVLHRVTAAVHRGGHTLVARFLLHLNAFVFKCEIQPQVVLGPGATITHPLGVAIGAGVAMGSGVRIDGQVRIGTTGHENGQPDGFPVIGDDCHLLDHCTLLGPIEIGARSQIGANALLLTSVSEDSVVVAAQGVVLG